MTEDTPTVELEDTRSTAEISRGINLVMAAQYRRQLHANEVALKGHYVDFLFDRLNLTKYR